MTIYTNNKNLSLAMAVWLVHDDYDYIDDPTVISATTLLKPIKAIVLARKNNKLDKRVDISTLVNSRMGTAIHSGVEVAWKDPENLKVALKMLGVENLFDRIKVNPEPEELEEDTIPVYVEQRVIKEVGFKDYKITGKFDMVLDGRVIDVKSTSVWTHIFGSKHDDYIKQGSIYRWANPEKITDDIMQIEYVFTDWRKMDAVKDPARYPQERVIPKEFPLMPIENTDRWIKGRVMEIDKYMSLPDDKLPDCTPDELWEKPTVWKYYKNPANKTRATKNFDNQVDAQARLAKDGFVGEVVEVKGEVVACRYCAVAEICEQAKKYKATGKLQLAA